jgi:hypothetical protein
MAPNTVVFRLSDGTYLVVQDVDLRRVYDELWVLSDVRGAISTAVSLFDEAQKREGFRQPVQLSRRQSDALRQAVAHFANLA